MKNNSIAIFGSSLRSDFDKYSDKDLLIAADDYETLDKLKKQYSNRDWSVSYYTFSKLKFLSEKGSLFLKHLQLESKLIIDKNGSLKNILSDHKLKSSYTNEINEAKDYFKMLKYIPKSIFGYAWLCDCLYVGLRNYLIFKNAENGTYVFSFLKLLEGLKEQRKINDKDFEILKEIRVIKRNYRESVSEELPSYNFIQNVINIFYKLSLLNSTITIDTTTFKENIENNILSNSYSHYQKLRLVEGYYCSQNIEIPQIKKIISNPQFYALKFKDNEYVKNIIDAIKKRHITRGLTQAQVSFQNGSPVFICTQNPIF